MPNDHVVIDPYTVDIADVTSVEIEGTGIFDLLMKAMKLHLQEEYSTGRITGDKYAEAYVALSGQVLSQAIQFALQHKIATYKIRTEASQTEDTVDGKPVEGTVGKQKDVYSAQIKGFKDDAVSKSTKMALDIFSVMRSTDDATTPPTSWDGDSIGKALTDLFTQVNKDPNF